MFKKLVDGAGGALAFDRDAGRRRKNRAAPAVYHRDSPASMSVHEEGTISVIMPMMGVFNNLVIFDQHVPQNS